MMLLKDSSDPRDLTFPVGSYPPSYDLKQYVTGVENQGTLNSCTNEAVAAMYEMLLKKFKPAKYQEFSRTFVWYNTRKFSGIDLKQNVGVTVRSLLKAMEKYGNCYEALHSRTLPDAEPTKQAYKNAKKFVLKSYQRCTSTEAIMTAIAAGFPVFLAMNLRNDFGSGKWEGTPIGGHAMVIVGYTPTHAIVLNSWGKEWSGDGYIEIPWDILQRDGFDYWAVTGIKTWLDKAWKLIEEFLK